MDEGLIVSAGSGAALADPNARWLASHMLDRSHAVTTPQRRPSRASATALARLLRRSTPSTATATATTTTTAATTTANAAAAAAAPNESSNNNSTQPGGSGGKAESSNSNSNSAG